ncbi:hypothetical protein [Streptomyces sp. KR80]
MTRTAVVVGAGVFGLSRARELGARGWHVTVVDALMALVIKGRR